MGLFNFGKPHRYDMDTLEGINSIPIPAKNYNTGDPTKDCIYYVLQRKATEHKKNGKMDLAIACLRKSNQLSDYEPRPLLLEKDYLRLVKYIRLTGNNALADAEEINIYLKHPEFKNKCVSNLPKIKESINKNKSWGNDLVIVNTSPSCPVCSKYNNKIYSISGKSRKYPKLPPEITQYGGFCPNCYLGLNAYFEGINTPPASPKEHLYITVNGHTVDIFALYTKYPTNKVAAIKELHHLTHCSLTESKKQIDDYYAILKRR